MDSPGNYSTHPDNWIYYAQIGNGEWTGTFSFTITKWKLFWRDKIGVWDRLFSIANHLNNYLFGVSKIISVLKVYPLLGPAGTITNIVFIKKLGITIYELDERYVLHPDGSQVYVHSRERLGPFPFLFNRHKKHPARILKGGEGAVYLDMPILGTLWEGNYTVSATKEKIDAKLHCAWAEGRESIHKKKDGPKATQVLFSYPEKITEVISILERYRDWFEMIKDPRATFTHAYLEMTQLFAAQIPIKEFVDKEWVYTLDVLFAREYLKAMHAYDQGIETKSGWEQVFVKIMNKKTSVFEELILSMAAHIIQDLPYTLHNSGWRLKPEAERIHDFHLANDILGDAIEAIQKGVGTRYNPILNKLDMFGKDDDEILTNYGVRLCRGMAWYNAVRLMGDPEIAKSLTNSVAAVIKQIVHPPFSLYFFLRIFRFISKVTRRWPALKEVRQTASTEKSILEYASPS